MTSARWAVGMATRLLLAHPASGGTEEFDAVMTIVCLVGDQVPAGAEESVAFDVPGVITFDQPVSGENLFVNKHPKGKHQQKGRKHRHIKGKKHQK